MKCSFSVLFFVKDIFRRTYVMSVKYIMTFIVYLRGLTSLLPVASGNLKHVQTGNTDPRSADVSMATASSVDHPKMADEVAPSAVSAKPKLVIG